MNLSTKSLKSTSSLKMNTRNTSSNSLTYHHKQPISLRIKYLTLWLIGVLFCTLANFSFADPQNKKEKRAAKELRCLALNIYFEARGETTAGQLAVALVTLNRMKNRHYPNTICGVVWQKRQFSWTHDGKSDNPTDKRAWKLVNKIARFTYQRFDKLSERTRKALDLTKGALHYYAPQLADPYWAKIHTVTTSIGGHVFLTGRS